MTIAALWDGDFGRRFLSVAEKRGGLQRWRHKPCILPLLHHLLFLCFCHVVTLLYASDVGLPLWVWQAWGKIDVKLLHLIMEYTESRSTTTFHFHGLSQAFGQALMPIQYSDEAGERDLRLDKTFATLTTTCAKHSTRETPTDELYIKYYHGNTMPVKAGGHKYTCGSLSGGRGCWKNVFSLCCQSGVSFWSAFCGHYWHCKL